MPVTEPTFSDLTLLARLAALASMDDAARGAGEIFAELGEPGWTAIAPPDAPGFTEDGFYEVANAEGVLLYNAEADALAIGFRGVGGEGRPLDLFEAGFAQDAHFAKFQGLLDVAAGLVEERGVETVYVGGHSLGGAMVQHVFAEAIGPFAASATVVGAAFASPGAIEVPIEPSAAETELLHAGAARDPVFGLLDNPDVLPALVEAAEPLYRVLFPELVPEDPAAAVEAVLAFPSLPRGGPLQAYELPLFSAELDPVPPDLPLPAIHDSALNARVFGELNELGLTTEAFLDADRLVLYFTPDGEGSDDVFASGNAGDDIVLGDAGHDLLLGARGRDVLDGGEDGDLVGGGPGDDRLFGGGGWDLVLGGRGDDGLDGGAGRDALFGGPGADLLDGGEGLDILVGGRGSDTFILASPEDRDLILDYRPDEGDAIEFDLEEPDPLVAALDAGGPEGSGTQPESGDGAAPTPAEDLGGLVWDGLGALLATPTAADTPPVGA